MHLSIFDLDKTLLKTNISFKFYLFLYNKNNFDKKSIFKLTYYFIKFKYFNMPIKNLHSIVFEKFLKGREYNSFTKDIDIFLDKYLDKIFYLPAISKLQKAIFENHRVAIFSSSPIFLVEPIAKILKVDEYRATKYFFDKDNKFEKIALIMDGEKKSTEAIALMKKLNIAKQNISVYSDSIQDLDLFEIAQKKVAVRPCKKLYKISKEKNWEII